MIERINVSESGNSFVQSQITQSLDAFQSTDFLRSPDSEAPGSGIGGSGYGKEDSLIHPRLAGNDEQPSPESRVASPEDRVPSRERRTPGSRPGKQIGRRRLNQFVQALAEQMLGEGATTEDVARAARDCGFTQTTAAKLERWLEQDTDARRRILRRQINGAKDVPASLPAAEAAGDEVCADAEMPGKRDEFAPAATSSRAHVQNLAAVHRSLRAQLKNENDSLKRRAQRLEARKAYLARRIEHAQMRLNRARLEVVQRRLKDLRDALEGGDSPEQEAGRSVFAEIVGSLCQLLKIGER